MLTATIRNISSIVEGSAQELEYASLLAGYSLTLLRCFPREEDTIRMRLYLGDMSWRGREVPLVHYFWQAMKGTGVYAQILHDVGAPQRLLQPRSLRSASAQVTPLEKEWRIVIAFLELYTFLLRLTDDDDFFAALDAAHIAEDSPSRVRACSLSLEDVRPLTVFLKNLAFALFYNSLEIQQTAKSDAEISSRLDAYLGGVATKAVPETSKSAAEQQLFFAGISGIDFELMRNTVTTTLRMLHERDSRRKFLPQDHWLMTSRFDMEGFIPAVVMEEQRQRALRDADEEDEDEEEPVHEPEDEDDLYFATSTSRLSRHARIEALREKQRKVQRERMLASVGPRLEVLRNIPFVIPFKTRVQIFRQFIYLDKDQRRGGNVDPDLWRHAMLIRPPSGLQTGRDVLGRHSARIRRTNAFEDALDQFYELGDGLKEPIQIQFIDQFGQVEAGIDGGGVTKEFLTTVTREAFYEPKGIPLFVANEKNLLYPNPNAMDQLREYLAQQGLDPRSRLYQEQVAEFLKRYEFLGRVVGKCLYEGILVDIAFAGFFLLKWTQAGQSGTASGYRYNFNDLRDMDESLYQGLLALKNYKGDVSDLDLDFTVEDVVSLPNQPTKTVTHELMPGGARVKVTNENRPLYLSYMARHRLSVQPHAQSRAFLQGLGAMIEPSWLSMFNQLELQRLVGGDSSAIDVEDLRRNTEYSGAYTIGEDGQEHPTVRLFWEVMHELDHDTRCKVLRYVTSTPRAPLLGFSQLSPKFSIRDGGQDESRLPSTSTCVNLLKLPQYRTKKTLKEKLLYAVMSNAGFDLS